MKRKIVLRGVWGLLGLVLAAGLVVVGINVMMVQTSKPYILGAEQAKGVQADCVLILGAGVWGETMSWDLQDRVNVGIDLYQAGAAKKILMSGDHSRVNYDEVNAMKNHALERGVPAEDVFLDHAGFTTYESMYRARDIFLCQKIIIVTQGYHMGRALYTARNLGLEAYGVTADLREYQYMETNLWRERLARVKAFGMGIVKPKPTFLGKTIPISGSGLESQD
ncbi:MAG: YdcF family protein [Peptococcaceae bacterium]|nr:YdcF family protein [Peptococcaceae bacterium]